MVACKPENLITPMSVRAEFQAIGELLVPEPWREYRGNNKYLTHVSHGPNYGVGYMTPVDALVAGAGPGGCAIALSPAQRGGQVVLVEPRRALDRGLSGEWLQPAGVTALRRLGASLHGTDFTENHGFMVYPGLVRAPITLPYPHGCAVSMGHRILVDRLRQTAAEHPGNALLSDERVIEARQGGHVVTTGGTFRAGMVVGANSRASLPRRTLRPEEPPAATLSSTAGFELIGARLPVEGYGHIFLGGPGSVLAYRIDPDTIRISVWAML